MHTIAANYTVSISELRKNPGQLIRALGGATVAILNRNTTSAYLVAPHIYEQMLDMLDMLEDQELQAVAKQRLKDRSKAIKVSLDDL